MKSPLLRSPSNAADDVLDMRDSPTAKHRRAESKGTLARVAALLLVLISLGVAGLALAAGRHQAEANQALGE